MARDTSRRGTPRKANTKKAPKSQEQRSASTRASRTSKPSRATKTSPASVSARMRTKNGAARVTPSEARAARQRNARRWNGKTVRNVLIGLAACAIVALIAFFILRSAPVFAITNITVEPTAHVTNEDIQKLVAVPEGTTLLNMDEQQITENLKKDPWVASVTYERQFPNTLHITIQEHKVSALVAMSTGPTAWYLSDEGTWLQQINLSVGENNSVGVAALAQAEKDGVLLVSDVPATVSPVAGAKATDEVIEAVLAYQSTFTSELTSQIVSYSAASADSINITLSNGIQVALGSPTQIEDKEKVILSMVRQYAGEMTYLNVRVPASPTYRRVTSGNTQNGTGISNATSQEQGSSSDSLTDLKDYDTQDTSSSSEKN